MTYGLLAVGLVLVYRSNRIINFAHGEIGAFGAAVFGVAGRALARSRTGSRCPLRARASAGVGGARRGRGHPPAAQRADGSCRSSRRSASASSCSFFSAAVNAQVGGRVHCYPQPPGLPEFERRRAARHPGVLGHAGLRRPSSSPRSPCSCAAAATASAIRGAAGQPRRGAHGRHLRRPDVVAGVGARRRGRRRSPRSSCSRRAASSPAESFGPTLLLRALAAAVIARMTSLPDRARRRHRRRRHRAAAAVELPARRASSRSRCSSSSSSPCCSSRGVGGREEEKGSWAAVQPWPPLPDALAQAARGPHPAAGSSAGVALVVAAPRRHRHRRTATP